MVIRRTHVAGILIAAALLLVVPPVPLGGTGAQDRPVPPPPPSQPAAASQGDEAPARPTFRTEANYVRVDVYPTEKGVPVRDLTKEDFELFEDDTPQRIEQFELVDIQGHVPQTARREPQTVAESREMAQDPRSRVFILFLDTYHTGVAGSHQMRTALTTLLDRVLGPDDLVGVMTPEMSAADVTLARRTETIEAFLSRHWDWGRRDRQTDLDPEEEDYVTCYPREAAPVSTTAGDARTMDVSPQVTGVAQEMIARRREKLVMDGLTDLVVWLRGIREERKAVLAVTDGWRLFRPNRALANTGNRTAPMPGIGVDPTGRISSDIGRDRYGDPRVKCEQDRLYLSELDNDSTFRQLIDRANRANVSFYPIDSRGLPVFDTPIEGTVGQPMGPENAGLRGPATPSMDQALLRQRLDSLQTIANATDGIAVVNSNDIERGLKRVVADLTSYYLLGYYSTNTKLDGRFRSIKVRVKRPGVDVRARRGYLAATEDEMKAFRSTSAAAPPAPAAAALQRELGRLAALRPDARVRTHVGWLNPSPGTAAVGRLWAVAELDRTLARTAEWSGGARMEVTLAGDKEPKLAATTVDIPAGQRTATIDLSDLTLPAGDIALRLRVTPASGGLPLLETIRFTVPAATAVGGPRLWRRGPSTGPQFVRTGDAAFRRNEQLRVEVPLVAAAESVKAELLDRMGKVLPIPVAARPTSGADLQWAVADLALAPLAEADYAVRVTVTLGGTSYESLAAFRIVP